MTSETKISSYSGAGLCHSERPSGAGAGNGLASGEAVLRLKAGLLFSPCDCQASNSLFLSLQLRSPQPRQFFFIVSTAPQLFRTLQRLFPSWLRPRSGELQGGAVSTVARAVPGRQRPKGACANALVGQPPSSDGALDACAFSQ